MDRLKARDKLYKYTLIWAMAFTFLCCVAMVLFKINETALDTYNAMVLHRETNNNSMESISYARYNMQVIFHDEAKSKLMLPLIQPVGQEQIEVCEEFTEHKLVITLKGAAPCVEVGTQVTSDSSIMDAVGVYRRQEDIVVEIYCNDTYAYELTDEKEAVTVSFVPLRSRYDILSVIYLPTQDKDRLKEQDRQILDKLSRKYGMKIFASYDMDQDYTQQEIVQFANEIHADMLIGVDIEKAQKNDTVTTVCNPEYFIPDFGGVELATVMTDCLSQTYGVKTALVTASDDTCPLTMQAAVPAAMTVYYSSQDTTDRPELEYDLNRKLMTAINNILEQTLATYYPIEK